MHVMQSHLSKHSVLRKQAFDGMFTELLAQILEGTVNAVAI